VNKSHLAIDLDDVVLDFWPGVCRSLNLEYGVNLDPVQTRDWDDNPVKQLDVFGPGRCWWDWLKERDWIWATFPPVNGAIGSLAQLRRAGFYLECVTSKPEWAEWATWKWLGKWRPPFNRVTIVNGSTKKNAPRKVDVTDAYLLIDDKPSNVEEFWNKDRAGRIFKQPWNKGCYDWPMLVKELISFKKEGIL